MYLTDSDTIKMLVLPRMPNTDTDTRIGAVLMHAYKHHRVRI